MKEVFLALISRNRKPMDGRLRNRLSVFLICVVLSVIMWGLIKLTRDYEIPMKYEVALENLPDGKVMTGNPDSVITITVHAKGGELYSRLFARKEKNVLLSLKNIRLRRSGDLYTGYLRTSKLLSTLSQQLPPGTSLVSVEPDTLHFIFEKSFSRRIPVITRLSLDFSKQYQLYDSVQLLPDTIVISGKKEIIDTIGFIATEEKEFSRLEQNTLARLKLIKPETYPQVNLSADSITVRLNVEKFTEASIEVPVGMQTGGKRVSYRVFPDKVTLTCRVALRDYKRLDPSLVSVLIDYDELSTRSGNRAPVMVSRQPSFLKVIRIDPEKVEFLILKD